MLCSYCFVASSRSTARVPCLKIHTTYSVVEHIKGASQNKACTITTIHFSLKKSPYKPLDVRVRQHNKMICILSHYGIKWHPTVGLDAVVSLSTNVYTDNVSKIWGSCYINFNFVGSKYFLSFSCCPTCEHVHVYIAPILVEECIHHVTEAAFTLVCFHNKN